MGKTRVNLADNYFCFNPHLMTLKSLQIAGFLIPAVTLLSGCGGSDGNPSSPPASVPAPAPTPSPTPTPTPTSAGFAKLQASLSEGRALTVDASAGATVTTLAGTSSFTSPEVIAFDDPRIRWLGGKWISGPNYPYDRARVGQSTTYRDPADLNGAGLPRYRAGENNGVQFVLPANQNEFEAVLLDSGSPQNINLIVDGFATSASGYSGEQVFNGSFKYTRFSLPPSGQARTVTVNFGFRPFMGLRLPSGGTIDAAPTANASVVFIGDSITEGAVSTMADMAWPMQAAYRLGIPNSIVSGVGGSGYLKRYPSDTGYNFRDRIDDVLTAVDGGPPDAVIIAGGINDCSVAPGGPYSADEVGSAALTYFRELRSGAPDMPIFVLGPFTDYNHPDYSQTLTTCRDAIFLAASQVSETHTIDVSDWVTSANRDIIFDGTNNGPHPINAGHAIYGQRAAEAMIRILNGRM